MVKTIITIDEQSYALADPRQTLEAVSLLLALQPVSWCPRTSKWIAPDRKAYVEAKIVRDCEFEDEARAA